MKNFRVVKPVVYQIDEPKRIEDAFKKEVRDPGGEHNVLFLSSQTPIKVYVYDAKIKGRGWKIRETTFKLGNGSPIIEQRVVKRKYISFMSVLRMYENYYSAVGADLVYLEMFKLRKGEV